jgi:hypothetical protein
MSFDWAAGAEKARTMLAQGASNEDILGWARREGASMMESVKLMRQIKAATLQEAQEIVHESSTWADEKESWEQLQNVFAEALKQLAQETGGQVIEYEEEDEE